MSKVWALQDAKNRLSEVVEHAVSEGPQTITRRGKEIVVVLSIRDFRRLAASSDDLVTFFRQSPLAGVELDLERNRDYGRKVEL